MAMPVSLVSSSTSSKSEHGIIWIAEPASILLPYIYNKVQARKGSAPYYIYYSTSSPLWALEYHFAFVDCVGGAVEVVQQLRLGGGIGAASQDEGVGLLDGAPLYAYG